MSTDELAAAVEEYIDVTTRIGEDTARKAELAEIIAKFLAAGEKYEVVPGVGVQVTYPPRRFDPELAARIMTPEQIAQISVPVMSSAMAKRLYPILFEASRTAGTPTVRRI